MKKLLCFLGLLTISKFGWSAGGGQNALTVSSGTYLAVDLQMNNSGANRQVILVGNNVSSDVAHVDQIQGLQVYLGTSTAANIGTIGNTGFNINNSIPAGGNIIGVVDVVSTNTLNTSQQGNITLNALPAGGNIIGVVDIVSTNTLNTSQQGNITLNALPAGGNIIGVVDIVSTNTLNTSQQGNITLNALPAGGNIIGVVDIVSTNTLTVGGTAASGASPVGNPLQNGMEAFTAWPSAVSNAQMVAAAGDKMGRTIAALDCPYDLQISTTVTLTASTSETLFLSSGTTGVYNDLVSLVVTNSGATSSLVTLRNTGFGTTGWIHIMAPAGDTRGLTTSHVWPQQSSASDWTVQGASSSSSIYLDAVFCQRK